MVYAPSMDGEHKTDRRKNLTLKKTNNLWKTENITIFIFD